MKPGRNDPCPCGSGRKYKHCCLLKEQMQAPEDLAWRRVRRAVDGLATPLLREAIRHFGNSAIDEAWTEFNLLEEHQPFDMDTLYMQVFMPWFLYDWLPDPHDTAVPAAAQTTTAAAAYLQRAGRQLDPIARRYIEACAGTPFSFHEVLACEPGRGFRLRDVLLGGEVEVLEQGGSAHARPGDMVYGKVVPIEGLTLLDGSSPILIPPIHKTSVIELRSAIVAGGRSDGDPVGAELLREWDSELRELYLEIAGALLNPQMPQMQNTDGDPLEMHTLNFDLDAPQAAFDALKDLAAGLADEHIDGRAERDSAGKLVRAEITWRKLGNKMHKHWDNTTLGLIRIDGKRLTAEVNSAKRAADLRTLIEQRLGKTARALPAVVKSVQSMLTRKPSLKEQAARQRHAQEQAEFAARPEVQHAMREHLRGHYRYWVDENIPALGNRTPRKAVRDPDGREAVEALIAQIERNGERMSPPLDPDIVRELRQTLGLAAR